MSKQEQFVKAVLSLSQPLMAAVRAAARETPWPGLCRFDEADPDVYMVTVARRDGRVLGRRVSDRGRIDRILGRHLTTVAGAHKGEKRKPAYLEISVCHGFEPLTVKNHIWLTSNRQRGLKGVRVALDGQTITITPMDAIARDANLEKCLVSSLQEVGYDMDAIWDGRISAWLFDAVQLHAVVDPAAVAAAGRVASNLIPEGRRVTRLHRGGESAPREASAADVMGGVADGMIRWMHAQVLDTGRMVYKYWPSRGLESEGDNTIRQWMATLCLYRIARHTGRDADMAYFDRNLAYNLGHYYRQDGDLGLIVERVDDGDKVKLGALALAAQSLLESGRHAQYPEEYAGLCAAIDDLWQDNGKFTTFYTPPKRMDGQNFYPGEALCFWAERLLFDPAPDLRARFEKSFQFYRNHFRNKPNPAFVPWHTQAYFRFFDSYANEEMESFIFEMNDWLLEMQQVADATYPDLHGRFYNQNRPDFGRPHASSTGVYMEGLVDAARLAAARGDTGRAAAYSDALRRGAGNLFHLQFKTPAEMFYVRDPERVLGGLRTEMYRNEIRVDNVQHGLMALMKMLTPDSAETGAREDAA
jgi:hypothetical protein